MIKKEDIIIGTKEELKEYFDKEMQQNIYAQNTECAIPIKDQLDSVENNYKQYKDSVAKIGMIFYLDRDYRGTAQLFKKYVRILPEDHEKQCKKHVKNH